MQEGGGGVRLYTCIYLSVHLFDPGFSGSTSIGARCTGWITGWIGTDLYIIGIFINLGNTQAPFHPILKTATNQGEMISNFVSGIRAGQTDMAAGQTDMAAGQTDMAALGLSAS